LLKTGFKTVFLAYRKGEYMKLKKVSDKKKQGRKVAQVLLGTFLAAPCFVETVLASVDSVTAPLTNLKTLVLSIIAAVGVIILAKNVMEFAQAYQQQDSSTMNSAIKGIVAGLIMAAISAVLTFLGIS